MGAAPAGLYFYEDMLAALESNNIDPAPAAAVSGLENRVALILQVPVGVFFSPLPEAALRRGYGQPPPEGNMLACATGAKERRWMGQGPSSFNRSKWALVG